MAANNSSKGCDGIENVCYNLGFNLERLQVISGGG
jgi:hypothetical protein